MKTGSSSLGTILVDGSGMTLYSLSAEKNGKFICTASACTAIWHPLTVSAGATPSGVSSLGVVKRPDGTTQVTYKGAPLYTFAQDQQPGDTKGQGFKDVGTWGVVTVGAAPLRPRPARPPRPARRRWAAAVTATETQGSSSLRAPARWLAARRGARGAGGRQPGAGLAGRAILHAASGRGAAW